MNRVSLSCTLRANSYVLHLIRYPHVLAEIVLAYHAVPAQHVPRGRSWPKALKPSPGDFERADAAPWIPQPTREAPCRSCLLRHQGSRFRPKFMPPLKEQSPRIQALSRNL